MKTVKKLKVEITKPVEGGFMTEVYGPHGKEQRFHRNKEEAMQSIDRDVRIYIEGIIR